MEPPSSLGGMIQHGSHRGSEAHRFNGAAEFTRRNVPAVVETAAALHVRFNGAAEFTRRNGLPAERPGAAAPGRFNGAAEFTRRNGRGTGLDAAREDASME